MTIGSVQQIIRSDDNVNLLFQVIEGKQDHCSFECRTAIENETIWIRINAQAYKTKGSKRQNKMICHIPNSIIVNNAVVNSGANAQRRVDFTFSVAYESDVELVKKIVTDCMLSNGKVYDTQDKKPFCRLKTLGASSLDFFANCWCDTEDYWDVYYYVMETVYNEFKKHNISVPYNQLEVRQRTDTVDMPFVDGPLPQRVEKVRPQPQPSELEKLFHLNRHKKKKAEKKAKKNNGSEVENK